MTANVALGVGLLALSAFVACEPKAKSDQASDSFDIRYDLNAQGGGDSYGTLQLIMDGEEAKACWTLTIEDLPKALQLHEDAIGPNDPVVASLYEPPSPSEPQGCAALDQEIAGLVRESPEGFYIDGHNSDDEQGPVIWALLREPD